MAELSNKLQDAMRRQRAERYGKTLDEMIERAQAGEKLKKLGQRRRRRRIPAARDTDGTIQTNRNSIAELFATFYEAPYAPVTHAFASADTEHMSTSK
jgi:hypothetical protein